MKKAIFFILLFAAAANLSAQTFTEWHDAAVNEINRQQMHATFFAYESADAARRGDPYASERFLPRISSARTTTTARGARCPFRGFGS